MALPEPARCGLPANGYGLFEVCGNVWERTTDWFASFDATVDANGSCCDVLEPRVPEMEALRSAPAAGPDPVTGGERRLIPFATTCFTACRHRPASDAQMVEAA